MAEVIWQSYWSKTQNAPARIAGAVLIRSPEELRLALEGFGTGALKAAGQALFRIAEETMTAAKRITPVDTGNLKNSGHVQPPTQRDGGVSVTLGFGGPAGVGNQGPTNRKPVGYALAVHERLDIRHVNGQAKYLETPILEAAAHLEEFLARDLRAEFARARR